jgi:hypothetical protein
LVVESGRVDKIRDNLAAAMVEEWAGAAGARRTFSKS